MRAGDPTNATARFTAKRRSYRQRCQRLGPRQRAGDSLAAILNDLGTNAPDPGRMLPWTIIQRRHDHSAASGWAWGGIQDDPFTGGRLESLLYRVRS